MGWKDAPVVGGNAWESAPLVDAPKPDTTATGLERVNATTGGLNRGISGLLGLPVDTVENVLNLGKAGVGTVAAMAGRPDLAPEVTKGSAGGSEWIAKQMEKAGIGTTNPRPDDATSRFLNTAGTIAGGSMVPGARLAPTVAAAASGAVAGETLGPEWVGPAAMAPATLSKIYADTRGKTLAKEEKQNAIKDQTAEDSRKAGYTIPPTQTNPSLPNKVLEGFAGKITTAQLASSKNQNVTNSLAKKSLGLPDDAPLTEKGLADIRANAGQAYQAIKDFGGGSIKFKPDIKFRKEIEDNGGDFAKAAKEFPELVNNKQVDVLKGELTKGPISPAAAVELIKKLRQDSSANFKAFDNNEKIALAKAQRSAAESLENLLDRNLLAAGKADLVKDFRAARTIIAKAHDVESALNETTGNVSTRVLSRIADKKNLSGDLAKAADFGKAFPKASQTPEGMGSIPGISPLDYVVGAAGAGGAVINPLLLGVGVARPGVRFGILSDIYQNTMGKRSYTPAMAPEGDLATLARQGVISNR